jgi:hypothetical protein
MDSSTDYIRNKLLEIRLKLLDLGKRNRLLNFRHNKDALQVIDELPKQVFDELVKFGRFMTFLPTEPPEEKDDDLFIDNKTKNEITPLETNEPDSINISDELPEPNISDKEVPKKHRDNKLQTKLFAETLEAQLRRIASKARTIINETGQNQLYLVLGFLKWRERNDSSRDFEAPLVMIPVQLKKEEKPDPKTRCYQYTIQYTGEDLIPNLSLREKLKKDFDLILPDFEDELTSVDEEGSNELDPELYFDLIRGMLSKLEGWEVHRRIVLGFFSFSKLMMYLDLDPKRWPNNSLEKNPHIHRLLGFEESSANSDVDSVEKNQDSEQFPLILDADSSQTNAIQYAMNGHNMIIQGPPGTGKSQTITNLIACFLNAGKSVLFLAEKMAALNIVHRNLEKVGLADFCLELHSHKADKGQVRDSLKTRSNLDCKYVHFNAELSRLKWLKESLGKYIIAITKPVGPKGETVYEVFGKAESLRMKLTDPLGLTIRNLDSLHETEMQDIMSLLEPLSRQYQEVGNPRKNTWYGFEPEKLFLGDENKVAEYLEAARDALARIHNRMETCYTSLKIQGGHHELTCEDLEAICKFVTHQPPNDIQYDIAAKILHSEDRKAWEHFDIFQQLVHKYQVINAPAKKVFLDPQSISANDANTIGKQIERLLEWEISIIDKPIADNLSRNCSKLLSAMKQYDDYAKKALPTKCLDRYTLSGIDRLEVIHSLLLTKPKEIACMDISKLFSSSTRAFVTEIFEEADRLVGEREALNSVFAINDICAAEELSTLRKIFRQAQGIFFKSFSKEYRRAKRIVRSFVKIDSIMKNHAIPDLLERLECLLRDEKNFNEHITYRMIFGELFRGLKTDWDRLRYVLAWVVDLIEATESVENAKLLVENYAESSNPSESNKEFVSIIASIKETIESYTAQLVDIGCSDSLEDVLSRNLCTLLKQIEEQRDICLSITNNPIISILPDKSDIRTTINSIKALLESKELQTDLDNNQQMNDLLDSHFKGAETNVDSLAETINWALKVSNIDIPEGLLTKLTIQDMGTAIVEISKAAESINKDLELFRYNINNLSEFGKLDIVNFFGGTQENLRICDIEHKLTQSISDIPHLIKWADYRRYVHKGNAMGLEEIVEAIESEILPPKEACDAYLHSVYDGLARSQIRNTTELATFTRVDYEAKRAKFAEIDNQILQLNRQKVAHQACQNEPPRGQSGRVMELTDMFLLNHEFPKTRRLVPIRQLMNRAGNAIKALKPVFMMSPMSVAQFLEPGKHHFDVIIMDEASQIQPHDALGALARADQMIVVGDSNQLPPTNFFEKIMNNPEDEKAEDSIFDDTDADSSILQMCNAIKMFERLLKWHYRSEHESLIAFSNSL